MVVIASKRTRSQAEPNILTASNLARERWLLHGWSTRHGGCSGVYGKGSLNLGFTSDDKPENVRRNREILLQQLETQGLGSSGSNVMRKRYTPKRLSLVSLRQVHSSHIYLVGRAPSKPLVGDGMVTDRPGLVLAVQAADCLPILIADPVHKAVGAFHAGWRGTLARIVEKGVGSMRLHFGSDPRRLLAAIGPGIGRCCYSVGSEVQEVFKSQFDYADELFHKVFMSDPVRERYPLLFMTARAPGHSDLGPELHLDLAEANRRQLVRAGLKEENIAVTSLCTACNSGLLFSHRAERGKTGRMMGVIGIKPGS